MPPLVSICLPNLNTCPFLEERMETILAQTVKDWELIICDSYSDDGSWEFFQKFKGDPRIRMCQVPREGCYAGWNECLRRTCGEYVYIATSDDTCHPELLEKMVGALECAKIESPVSHIGNFAENSQESGKPTTQQATVAKALSDKSSNSATEGGRPIDVAACRFHRIDSTGAELPPGRQDDVEKFLGHWMERPHVRSWQTELLIQLCLQCHWSSLTTTLFRRQLLERTGLFRTDCGSHADVPWRLKAIMNSSLLYLPDPLATFRVHDNQLTANRPKSWPKLEHAIIRQTLEESAHLIPNAWKQYPRWQEELLLRSRHVYLEGFHLDRNSIRNELPEFLLGCVSASVVEPRYLLSRLVRGFSWNFGKKWDEIGHLRKLVTKWQVPWPPTALDTEGVRHIESGFHGMAPDTVTE